MRVRGIFKPSDYPGEPAEAAELFETLFPGNPDPEFDRFHAGSAVVAHDPKIALHLAALSKHLALDTGWSQRRDLRELAIQTVNLQLRSEYSFNARRANAAAANIGATMLEALADWRTSDLFDAEQKLVIEYAGAVVAGDVPEDLFSDVVERYGERGAIEFTTIIAIWAAWAMIINAAKPEL